MEVKIKRGSEMLDATIEMVDGVMVVSPKVEKFEPKDGDVVYVKTSHENIIIYKEQSNKLGRYVNYIDESTLCTHMGDYCGSYSDIIEIRPSTEEEKKKLFDKLAEEGFEWKADTKELVKLKWKPGIGEKYYYPDFSEFNSSPYSYIWDNDETDEGIYARGWCFKTQEECQEFCNRLNDAINSVKP
jgi:hypothetical protein